MSSGIGQASQQEWAGGVAFFLRVWAHRIAAAAVSLFLKQHITPTPYMHIYQKARFGLAWNAKCSCSPPRPPLAFSLPSAHPHTLPC